MNSQKITKTTAKGNKIEIKNTEKKIFITTNGTEYEMNHLNPGKKIIYFKIGKNMGGVELTQEELEQIQAWEQVREEAQKAKDEKEEKEMKNNKVETIEIKFGNYYIEKYIHFDNQNEKTIGGYNILSNEAEELKHAIQKVSADFLIEKFGIKLQDGIWQTIKVTDEIKSTLFEELKRIEQVEAEKKQVEAEKIEAEKVEEENRKEALINKAKETGEKQVYSTCSVPDGVGNLYIETIYIDENGDLTKNAYYDGD